MALLFDDARHEYFLDGRPLPSVTGVLHASGLIDLSQIPPFILDRARTRGSAVHQLLHYLNESDLDWGSVDPDYRGYIDAWIAYREQLGLRVLLCEHRIASRRHRVAGTLDLLGIIADEGWLIDYKTGDPDDVSADFQTGAYLGMAFEWAADDSRLAEALQLYPRWRRAAVRLRKNGTFQVTEYTDARDYARFHTLVAAWHIRHEHGAIVQADDVAA
jgi:hypothetical protein